MAQLRLLNNIQYQISNAPQNLNMNGHNILDAGVINYSALNPPVGGGTGNFNNPSGTTLVFDAGIVGGVAIDFNGNNMTAVGDISVDGLVLAPTIKFSGNDSEQTTAYENIDVQTITADLQAGADHTFLWQSGTSNHNVNIDLNVDLPTESGYVLSSSNLGELSWIAMDGTGVDSVVGSTYISVNDVDLKNPIISLALPTPVATNGLVLASSTAGLLSWESVVATPSNAFYVNENVNMLEDVLPLMSVGDIVYISSGSFTSVADLTINKTNIGIIAPNVHPSITEVNYNLVYYQGTQLRTANLQFDCGVVVSSSNTRFDDCDFTNGLTITSSGSYLTFNNCEFIGASKTLTINVGSTAPILFTNVNFDGITMVLNNASPLLVFFNNCAGFATFPSTAKATFIGLNILQTLVSKVNTSSVIYGGDNTTQTTGYQNLDVQTITPVVLPTASVSFLSSTSPSTHVRDINLNVALPTIADQVLSSTTTGVLSWVAQSETGGNMSNPSIEALDMGGYDIDNVYTIGGREIPLNTHQNTALFFNCDDNTTSTIANMSIVNDHEDVALSGINFYLSGGQISIVVSSELEHPVIQFVDETQQATAYQNLDVQTITSIVQETASTSFLFSGAPSTHGVEIDLNVGLPTIADQVLSSTTAGVLSWVAQSGGTMNNPSIEALDMAEYDINNVKNILGAPIVLNNDPCYAIYLNCDNTATSTIANISIINNTIDVLGSGINFNLTNGTIKIMQENGTPQIQFKDETQQATAYQNIDVQTITADTQPNATHTFLWQSGTSNHNVNIDLNVDLPAESGYVLSSSNLGELSWVAQSGGTMSNPSIEALDMGGFNISNILSLSSAEGNDLIINNDVGFQNGGSSITFVGTDNQIDMGQSGTIKGFTELGFIDEATQVYTYQNTAYENLDVQTITPVVLPSASASFLTASTPSTHVVDIGLNVALPSAVNQVLSSSLTGILSWVEGGNFSTPSNQELDMGTYNIINASNIDVENINANNIYTDSTNTVSLNGINSLVGFTKIAVNNLIEIQAMQNQYPTTYSASQVITSLDGSQVATFYYNTNLTPPTCTQFQRYDTQTQTLGALIDITQYTNYQFPFTYASPQIITYLNIEWVVIIAPDCLNGSGKGGVQLLSVFGSDSLMGMYSQLNAGIITAGSTCILSKFGLTYAPNIVNGIEWTITIMDEAENLATPENIAWWQLGVAPPDPQYQDFYPLIMNSNQYSVQLNNSGHSLLYEGINSLAFFNQNYNYQDNTTTFNTTLTFQYNTVDGTTNEYFNGMYMLTWISTSGTPVLLPLGNLATPSATNNIIDQALIIPTAPSEWSGGNAIFNIVLLFPSGNLQTGTSTFDTTQQGGVFTINPDVATFSAPNGNSMVCSDCYSTSFNDPMAMANGFTIGHLFILAPDLDDGSVCYCSGIGGKIINIIKAYKTSNISEDTFQPASIAYRISFYSPNKYLYSAGYNPNPVLTALTTADTLSGILLAEQAIFSRSIQIPADNSIPLGSSYTTTNCGKVQLDTANSFGAKIYNHLITPGSIILLTKYGATNANSVYVALLDYGVAVIASSDPETDGDVVMYMICNS